MALEDTLRWADRWPMRHQWPETHTRTQRTDEPNWRWLSLWEQENPAPRSSDPDWHLWYEGYKRMSDRIWIAYVFPQFAVWDWPEEDIERARDLTGRHVCGVCSGTDDPGCVLGC